MRNLLTLKTLAGAAVILMTAALARAQNSRSSPPPPPAPEQPAPEKPALEPHKVWTNDDVVALRSPADEYLLQKEAQAAAEALAKQRAAATLVPQPSHETKQQPSSVEEAEQVIAHSLEDIQDQQATLERLSKDLDESPEDQKSARKKEIERRTAVLQESRKELKALQDRRDDLATDAGLANSTGKAITSTSARSSCDALTSSCPN
jgi:hypothetical protein